MNHLSFTDRLSGRSLATTACAALVLPLATPALALEPLGGALSATRAASNAAVAQGMTARKKVVLLAGAAALYYLYRRHQANSRNTAGTPQGQPIYYLSKNGRVYYRDANHQAHWVTAPTQPIAVPYDEARGYQGLQGYANSRSGETNLSRFAASGRGGM